MTRIQLIRILSYIQNCGSNWKTDIVTHADLTMDDTQLTDHVLAHFKQLSLEYRLAVVGYTRTVAALGR